MHTESTDKRTKAEPIVAYLTPREALILHAFLDRGGRAGNRFEIDDQAELRVLWDLGAILESWLIPPLLPNYREVLQRARDAVRNADEPPSG